MKAAVAELASPLRPCRPLTRSNFNITGADLYDLFGKYGPIRQVRLGTDQNLKTKGSAYVVFESPDDAKEAQTHLNGFHLMERYIVGECWASVAGEMRCRGVARGGLGLWKRSKPAREAGRAKEYRDMRWGGAKHGSGLGRTREDEGKIARDDRGRESARRRGDRKSL
jgi:hypothetical protein